MALDDTIARLAEAPLLGLLERDALRLLAFSADTRRLRADEVLFREGERSDGGYLVLSGEVAVTRAGHDDLVIVEPGALIGQMALFVRMLRPASAVARSRCQVLRISPTLMRRVLEEFPAAAVAVRDAVARDLTSLTSELARVGDALAAIDDARA